MSAGLLYLVLIVFHDLSVHDLDHPLRLSRNLIIILVRVVELVDTLL